MSVADGSNNNDKSEPDCATQILLREFKKSEEEYHDRLCKLTEVYITQLRKCAVSAVDMERMLLNKAEDITNISSDLINEVTELIDKWDPDNSTIGKVFLDNSQFWDLYQYFSTHFVVALQALHDKEKEADFASLVSRLQGLHNPPLDEIIKLPVARIQEYYDHFGKFLESLVDARMFFDHDDMEPLMKCREKIKSLIKPEWTSFIRSKQEDNLRRIASESYPPHILNILKTIDDSPSCSRTWNKESKYKKDRMPSERRRDDPTSPQKPLVILGKDKFEHGKLAPDIQNAYENKVRKDVMSGQIMTQPDSKCSIEDSVLADEKAKYRLIREEKVKLRSENDVLSRTFLLFKNLILICKKTGAGGRLVRKYVLPLGRLWISEYEEGIGDLGPFSREQVFIAGWPDFMEDFICQHIVCFSKIDERNYWFTALQRQIKDEKEKAENKKGSVKIYYKIADSNNKASQTCKYSNMAIKDIELTIFDSVQDLIAKAVQQCNMKETGDTYRIVFLVLQNNTQIDHTLMIGQEFPLIMQQEIQMMRQGIQDTSDTQILFILQHIISARADAVQNQRHRTTSFAQLFRGKRQRQGGTISELDLSRVDEQAKGFMFNVPLRQFMPIDTELPKPLEKMLVWLYTVGPETDGIMRITPSMTKVKKMIRELDAGEEIDYTEKDPRVVASVLKYFLRDLPDCLLQQSLFVEFTKWDKVIDPTDRLEAMKNLVFHGLPSVNRFLALNLFHVLSRIAHNHTYNKMTETNLGICIGHSLLTPQTDQNLPSLLADSDSGLLQNRVAEFLIKNVIAVFGPKPAIFQDDKQIDPEAISRRSAMDEADLTSDEEDELEEDKNEAGNRWLESLLQGASLKDRQSPSSSMYVELDSSPPPAPETPQTSPPLARLTIIDSGHEADLSPTTPIAPLPDLETGRTRFRFEPVDAVKKEESQKREDGSFQKRTMSAKIISTRECRAEVVKCRRSSASSNKSRKSSTGSPIHSPISPAVKSPLASKRSSNIFPKILRVSRPAVQTVYSQPVDSEQVVQKIYPERCEAQIEMHTEKDGSKKSLSFSRFASSSKRYKNQSTSDKADKSEKSDKSTGKKVKRASLRRSKKSADDKNKTSDPLENAPLPQAVHTLQQTSSRSDMSSEDEGIVSKSECSSPDFISLNRNKFDRNDPARKNNRSYPKETTYGHKMVSNVSDDGIMQVREVHQQARRMIPYHAGQQRTEEVKRVVVEVAHVASKHEHDDDYVPPQTYNLEKLVSQLEKLTSSAPLLRSHDNAESDSSSCDLPRLSHRPFKGSAESVPSTDSSSQDELMKSLNYEQESYV